MAVTITAPNSQVADRASGVQVSWTAEYPQSAYEILYRRKGGEAWDTFGRVASTETKATLDLSALDDFAEYHYRIICYSDDAAGTDGTTIYSGSDSSAAYSLIVVPANRVAAYKVKYGDKMVEVPIYDETSDIGISFALPPGVRGKILLGDPDSALASELRVEAGGQVRAALGSEAHFADSGIKARAYMAVKEQYNYAYKTPDYTYSYQYSYTSPTYTYYYRYSWSNPTYTYYYRYSYTKPTYYYSVTGEYVGPTTYYKYSYTKYTRQAKIDTREYQASPASYGYKRYSYNAKNDYGYSVEYGNSRYYIPAISGRYEYTTYYYTTSTVYSYGTLGGGAMAYMYYASGGGGTGYGYRSTTGGGTSYGYRSSTGGGGTGYGYRYTTGDGGYAYGYGYTTQYRYT